jgi:polyphosphate kinase 2
MSSKKKDREADKLSRKDYERELYDLWVELVKLQRHNIASQRGILVLFEGRDAAGKDGTIKRIVAHLSPRETRVVALGKPSDRDTRSWYFQRWVPHLPASDELVLLNRSWYNRAGVERVMGFCTRAETSLFLRQVPRVEQGLSEQGLRIMKLYLAVNRKEQIKRLDSRRTDPLKIWKLSKLDEEGPTRWDAYTEAQNDMFLFTHTPQTPWTVVNSNEKRTARVNAIRFVLNELPYADKDLDVAKPPDPDIVGTPIDVWPALKDLS